MAPTLALLLSTGGLFGTTTASATVLSIEPSPSQPTTCDSVAVVVKGELPGVCASLASVNLKGPVPLPTDGPVPQYAVRVQIVVRDANPMLGAPCPLTPVPYERVLRLPFHPSGQYHAVATEYVIPYFALAVPAGTDTSRVESNFAVSPDTCKAASCYLLDFHRTLSRIGPCDAGGAPGDTTCVEIALGNWEPVAGVQSAIRVADLRSDPSVLLSGDLLRPVRARAIGRADGFHVAWTTDESTIKFMLYSDDGATIPEGFGPVLRVCYAIGHGAAGPYFLRFRDTIVADPTGTAIPPCPTFAEVVGRFCVGEIPCDLDGNGRSNVLDIVRLLRCALGGPDSTVCPDSVMARADCNDDGTVDVRDVVCCIRKMLALGFGPRSQGVKDGAKPTRVRLGTPEWLGPGYGRVGVDMEPGSDFGAVVIEVEAAAGTQISSVEENYGSMIDPGSSPDPPYALQYDVGDGHRTRFLILRANRYNAPTGPFRAWVSFRAVDALGRDAAFRITGVEAGSWTQASPAAAEITQGMALVPSGMAPRVLPARPNPFTDATDISYEIPAPKHVTLRVYSVTGKLVRTLVDATVSQGVHRAPWNGRDSAGRVVSSGIYFVKLSDGTAESTIRIMRLK
jgi:hypothetical protein